MSLLTVKELKKVYTSSKSKNVVEALKKVNLDVEKGEYVAIMGESGSGKSTLLNILATIDKPTEGEVLLEGENVANISDKEISAFRRNNLGFVFQEFNLLDTLTLEDNILLPLVLSGMKHDEMKEKVKPIAEKLGIDHILTKYPFEVSGGQKQRVAVSRAIITEPKILFADEPTGALDSRSADELLELFNTINEAGQTILMVTHSNLAAAHASRVIFIKDGVIAKEITKGDMSIDDMYKKISDTLTDMNSRRK